MRPFRTAEIVAVGSELLTPHRLDTNSLFLTSVLNDLGITVTVKSVVGDTPADVAQVLRAALSRADIVLTTGGLGPTDDDVTRDVVAGVLGRGLLEDAEVMAIVTARFERRGIPMPAVNRRQAMVIDGASWLPNAHGTAPGQLIDLGDRIVVLLPGPPRELQPMFLASVAPRLSDRAAGLRLRRRLVRTTGRSESQIEELSQPIYSRLGQQELPIATTILAGPGLVELHLSAAGEDETAVDAALERGVVELSSALGDVVFSVDGRSIEEVVGGLLCTRGWQVAAAESCTGGLLLQRLTEVPGSSAWVRGGVVAYANDVKVDALGVDPDVLRAEGAVSESVARAMAIGVRHRLGAQIGVGITGVAGPGGGSDVRHGITLIATTGAKVGQVNGLSVVRSGEQAFGLTVRITARAWVGKGEVIDIEREVELGGPLHAKGVLILSGFLGARYAKRSPLSLTASLVFEQSYAGVEGDSASLAEACALLSALADMPLQQSIAVTGSMNQHGEVQAIGGVNDKIEGFFDVCLERGLTGEQGVVIPSSNARHLMLRSEVTAAVEAGTFHVWTVDTVDDALELLVGREAGLEDEQGWFPEGTINAAVDARLQRFAESSRRFQASERGHSRDSAER